MKLLLVSLLQMNGAMVRLVGACCYQDVDIKMGGKKDDGLIYERLSTIC